MKGAPTIAYRLFHPAPGEVAHNAAEIVEVAGQAVHTVDQDGVAIAGEFEQRLQLGAGSVLARGFVREGLVLRAGDLYSAPRSILCPAAMEHLR